MFTVEFIFGKVTDIAACNFLEKNSTAIVSQNFPMIHFKQSKWNKLTLPLGHSQENVHDGVHFGNSYCYATRNFLKKLHYSQFEGLLQKLWNKINKKLCLPRSSRQRCSVKKGIIRKFAKFIGNTCARVSF